MIPPKIIILGAGYAGLTAALTFQKKLRTKEAEVTLVNKNEYHYFTTRLHEPAAGTFPHDKTRVDIKRLINRKKVQLIQDNVVEIRTSDRVVVLENHTLAYDYLIVGLGAEPETFGIPGLMEYTFNRWNINGVRQLREYIEYQFATYKNDPKRTELLTFVVGGAGLTGIEFVSELADRVPKLCKEYDVDTSLVRLITVESAPVALPGFDPGLRNYATSALEAKGVEFILGTPIKACNKHGVVLASGKEIRAGTVVWAAGVRGNSIIEKSGFTTTRGRVPVDGYLRAPGHENVFIIGDCALFTDQRTKRPYPPTAQIAVQMGKLLAENIVVTIRGTKHKRKPFKPVIYGTVASLGREDAIGQFGKKRVTGYPAVIIKKAVDLRYLFAIGGIRLVLKKGRF
ncbi:NAD(P)/FAD-dependent oxidoreductase [Aneurinibacillus sp. Ricciae_BoGa-3]|uniref:NAD(P)/FAD-dependent oxidoreductase n=1 Tax=Aneurinibacillus sp. Ricciae_BoGa-3 TaxID=3022697 RepID=UPI0023408AF0|nr:NAD(P)/FAD-dependent oxidoreductase [Aneurinibacillus sp. Ricciae_BoGa-3]WCK52445.1 NAD(P)/FAD-dependent oxidoreductase [Aneurinibacillus sp. Ricciae_BoGa-3]